MSEPKRWLEQGSNAPEGARELLQHARASRAIDKRALALSAAAIAKLSATPAAAAALPLAAKLALSACAVAVVGVVAVRTATVQEPAAAGAHAHEAARGRAHARKARPAPPASVELAPAAPAPVEPQVEAAEPAATSTTTSSVSEALPPRKLPLHARSRVSPPDAPPAAVPAPDSLAAEVAQLDAARACLPSDPARALALALEHAAREPNGALAPERELIAIDALHRLGRREEARARADALLAHYPGSIYRQRVTRMLPP